MLHQRAQMSERVFVPQVVAQEHPKPVPVLQQQSQLPEKRTCSSIGASLAACEALLRAAPAPPPLSMSSTSAFVTRPAYTFSLQGHYRTRHSILIPKALKVSTVSSAFSPQTGSRKEKLSCGCAHLCPTPWPSRCRFFPLEVPPAPTSKAFFSSGLFMGPALSLHRPCTSGGASMYLGRSCSS